MKRYVTLLIFISSWLCCVAQFPEVGRMEYKKMPGKILGVSANIAFIAAMRQKQIPYQLRVRDGGHTWEYWTSALYLVLPFVSHSFQKQLKLN